MAEIIKIESYFEQRYKDRRVRGLCSSCNLPAVLDKTKCEAHLKVGVERIRRVQDTRIAEGLCPFCGDIPSPGQLRCQKHVLQEKKRNKERNKLAKEGFLAHYGGQCTWPDCGIVDSDLLTLDHVENDGHKERKIISSGNFYRSVIRRNFPAHYQLLCWNHQWKKRMMVLRKEALPLEVCGHAAIATA